MLGFDEQEFLSVIAGATDNIEQIESLAKDLTESGYDNLYLVGAGGTYASISPLAYMFKTNSEINYYHDIAQEVVKSKPRTLTDKSILVTSSLSGTTEDVIDLVNYANEVGATTVGFVGDKTSPLGQILDYTIENAASNDNLVEELQIQFFAFGAAMMKNRGEFPQYDLFIQSLKKMPQVLLSVRKENDLKAQKFAEKHKDTPFHMFVGAGNTYGAAYEYAMCVLEEMQWIATKSIHAAEFFHGTIEMTEKDMSFVLIKGEDETRPLVERVEHFVTKYSDVVEVFDTADFTLEGIPTELRGFFSPMVIATALERVSIHFEKVRGHSLEIRRYYRKVEY